MATNHAVHPQQLPQMVRRPRSIWPGLARIGMLQKQIAGDGNCLFASLSDQLYGTPDRHFEIRTKVIEHMRNFKPLFEYHVHKDDVQGRRMLRSATNATAQESVDPFEDYLILMARPGTYGGEPELVAFCQSYDQDVMVHLPKDTGLPSDHLNYSNEHRIKKPDQEDPVCLHICYGGDEETRAHYDSARTRDGSVPRNVPSPRLKAQDSRRNSSVPNEASPLSGTPTARALRNADGAELFQEVMQKTDASLFNHRARSTSVSSSHRSSSSKRSLEDDGDNPRRKRADRRKSTRKRTDMSTVAYKDEEGNIRVHSPTDNTPASTQDTEVSYDATDKYISGSDEDEYEPKQRDDEDDGSDYGTKSSRVVKRKTLKPSSRITASNKSVTQNNNTTIKLALRT
ncbi:OTU domain-containing protein 3 [Cyphellophora attinorum]|uniref:OTU domain-containing protein 3 n=1 Tax=Cyphellophora attinorum TaxID=1664694 RepID=A0A0N0NI83_9EURO|nr:OTU domain-containing protein 3 [Phialophora attinorum]KPI35139.1 OTU domain-containing protein 3 [Phialophora attinorum]